MPHNFSKMSTPLGSWKAPIPCAHVCWKGTAFQCNLLNNINYQGGQMNKSENTCNMFYCSRFCIRRLGNRSADLSASRSETHVGQHCNIFSSTSQSDFVHSCYRPQRKLRESNVFTPVCQSVHGEGGWLWVRGCTSPWTLPHTLDTQPLRSTSKRYASYWNAFLFKIFQCYDIQK